MSVNFDRIGDSSTEIIFDKIGDCFTEISLNAAASELEANIDHGVCTLTIKAREGIDGALQYAGALPMIPTSSKPFLKAAAGINNTLKPIKKPNKERLKEERERDARVRMKRAVYRCIRKKSCTVAIAARVVSFFYPLFHPIETVSSLRSVTASLIERVRQGSHRVFSEKSSLLTSETSLPHLPVPDYGSISCPSIPSISVDKDIVERELEFVKGKFIQKGLSSARTAIKRPLAENIKLVKSQIGSIATPYIGEESVEFLDAAGDIANYKINACMSKVENFAVQGIKHYAHCEK